MINLKVQKNRITILLLLITLAVLAVTAAQLFWIYNAYSLQTKNFKTSASEAVKMVTTRVEEGYGCFEGFTKINLDTRENLLMLYKHGNENAASDTVRLFSPSFIEDSLVAISSSFPFPLIAEIQVKYHYSPMGKEANLAELNKHNLLGKFHAREKDSLFSGNYPVTYFMGAEFFTNYIDSFLSINLQQKGITSPYYFLLKDEKRGSTILSNFDSTLTFEDEPFTASLYGNSYFFTPQKLYVWFPNESGYLIGKMWLILSGSFFVLVLLIIVAWTMARTILRQKKLSQMKNDFINNMTHEFKTPISNISLAIETVNNLKRLNDGRQIEDYLSIINTENERLSDNVEKILQLSASETHLPVIRQDDVCVVELLNEIKSNFDFPLEHKGGEIFVDTEDTSPVIKGDKIHLTNMLYNLTDNALKYNKNTPQIRLGVKKREGEVEISVSDNGIGIPSGETELIFNRFYRVSTGNIHDVKGFGLGLSYVKSVVDSHRGKISITSKTGKGTTFIIRLPYGS